MEKQYNWDALIEQSAQRGVYREGLRKQLQGIHDRLEQRQEIPATAPKTTNRFRLLIMGIAASVLLLIVNGIFQMSQSTSQTYHAEIAPLSADIIKGAKNNANAWIDAYEKEDYPAVVQALEPCSLRATCASFDQVYLGFAYLRLNEPSKAITAINKALEDEKLYIGRVRIAKYYLACAFLENGELDKAKQTLLELTAYNMSDQTYNAEAEALLKIVQQ